MELGGEAHLEQTVGLVEDHVLDRRESQLRLKQDVLREGEGGVVRLEENVSRTGVGRGVS